MVCAKKIIIILFTNSLSLTPFCNVAILLFVICLCCITFCTACLKLSFFDFVGDFPPPFFILIKG